MYKLGTLPVTQTKWTLKCEDLFFIRRQRYHSIHNKLFKSLQATSPLRRKITTDGFLEISKKAYNGFASFGWPAGQRGRL